MDTEKTLTLVLGETLVGLREIEEGKFRPKNSKLFESVLNKNEKSHLTDRFRVSLLISGDEQDALASLGEVEERMAGKKWILFVGDYSEDGKQFEKIKGHQTKADAFFPVKLKHCKNESAAKKAIDKISDIYENEYPYQLNFNSEQDKNESHEIQSFCFVATKEVKEESAILVKSLRMFHEQPLYVFCDKETEYFLSCIDIDLENVFFFQFGLEENVQASRQDFKHHPVRTISLNNAKDNVKTMLGTMLKRG